ncbi:MAG: NADH:ubiquinone oxidoreductase [Gemmobacter sp.]
MDEVPAKNAPSFGGWFMAAGVGLVTVGVAMVIFGFNVPQATGVAAVLFLVTGLILGQPDRPMPSPRQSARGEGGDVPWPAAMPAPVMSAAPVVGTKPEGLAAARGGMPDDLKIIKGIGPQLEKLCHSLGYYHFDQIAGWTAEEIAWVDDNLEGFKGRVTRDRWVAQAKVLAAGGSVA